MRGFLGAIPGLDAYAMLGKAWWHTTEREGGRPRYDLVILDGPASGHATLMLRIPGAILAAMPKGPLARDARAIDELLHDPARAALVIVTLPEELPVRETGELVRHRARRPAPAARPAGGERRPLGRGGRARRSAPCSIARPTDGDNPALRRHAAPGRDRARPPAPRRPDDCRPGPRPAACRCCRSRASPTVDVGPAEVATSPGAWHGGPLAERRPIASDFRRRECDLRVHAATGIVGPSDDLCPYSPSWPPCLTSDQGTGAPHLTAVRRPVPPLIDGHLDDAAWRAAPGSTAFTQSIPFDGGRPSEKTAMRVLYDESADLRRLRLPADPHADRRAADPPRPRLGERVGLRPDRLAQRRQERLHVRGQHRRRPGRRADHRPDDLLLGLGRELGGARPRAPGPAGRRRSGSRCACCASTAGCRCRAGDCRRRASSPSGRRPTFGPTSRATSPAPIAFFGRLDGLRDLKRRRGARAAAVRARLRAAATRARHRRGGIDGSGSAGLDLKWHITQDLTLDAALNPDFSQVELDQMILNLSQPRDLPAREAPVLSRGGRGLLDPAAGLLLAPHRQRRRCRRRCGTTPPAARSWSTSRRPRTIYGAAKLVGRLNSDWTVGALSAR